MNNAKLLFSALLFFGFVVISSFSVLESSPVSHRDSADTELSGASVLAFGPDNVLFVGDSKAGIVHAISTKGDSLTDPVPYNFLDFDLKLAEALEMQPRDLVIQDMKVHPVSQEVYVSVKKGHQPDAKSVIAIANPMGMDIRLLDIAKAPNSQVSIKNTASKELTFWRDIPAGILNITDIDYYEGYIYVAGISNGEFASTLRKIPYPFKGEQTVVGGIEIFHAIHTQKETRAPIRTMVITELEGVPTLIASYTCTPLVTIPLSEIQDGKKIVGTTIAELGYGNTPIDMFSYMAQEQDGSMDQKLFVTHKHRSGSLISMKSVTTAAKGSGLDQTKPYAGTPEGIPITPMPTNTVIHMDNQNQMMVAALKRNLETGGLDLVSEIKGVFLRLSEFISEYDFPDYKYDEKQAFTKQFHDMIKPMEGYPELTSDKTKK
ncbi:MAG: hypothetical protein AAGA10_24805 [Bacteroidota bacterium]